MTRNQTELEPEQRESSIELVDEREIANESQILNLKS